MGAKNSSQARGESASSHTSPLVEATGAPAAAAPSADGEAAIASEGQPRPVPAGAAGASPAPDAARSAPRGRGSSSAGSGTSRRPAASGGKRPGMWQQLHQGYADLVNAIIRPPRAEYSAADLGPTAFAIAGRQYQRTEVQVKNGRGLKLECSWWEPVESERAMSELPCVVYMHGNSSCRLEALELLPLVLQTGCTLFAFDFGGCGLSEGEHITLGYHEKDDAREVIAYLRESSKVSTIALWGRSMGAATALLHGHRDPSIAAMVLDSPFSSLERLAREIIDQAQLRHKPEILVRAFMRMMRSTILKRSGLDILKLRPIENVSTCFIPALFVAGNGDQFIPPKHATDICDEYAGDKNMVLVDGNHNSRRPSYFMDSVAIFFLSRLCAPVGLTEDTLNLRRLPISVDAAPQSHHRRRGGARDMDRHTLGYGSSLEVEFSSGDVEGREDQELQEVLLASLAAEASAAESPAAAPGAPGRLVGVATSRVQSTLPDRRTAASALQGI